ncbi:MAG TPA: diadenylate cyclase CdaA [Planctomycetota bacterium]|nr:diadenylate cyclase CdaA [Planctomycetota bacterium]
MIATAIERIRYNPGGKQGSGVRMDDALRGIQNFPITGVRAVVEIVLLAGIFYALLSFLRGSRGAGVLRGMLVLIFLSIGFVFIAAKAFKLEHIVWVFEKLAALSIVAGVIIFQPELRRGLLRLGLNPLIGRFVRADSPAIDEIVEACTNLSKASIGALIAIQRRVPLNDFAERGTVLNADITRELLETVFFKSRHGEGTILHDAGTIIIGNRIAAAGCLFPLSENPELSKSLGTRHRAALGMSEESDAVVVVVSEETGRISLAVEGKFTHGLTREELQARLTELVLESVEGGSPPTSEAA